MGVPESWVREDDKAGSVDLSVLALPRDSWDRPDLLSFRSRAGLWFEIKPMDETEIQPDNSLYPVHLEFGSTARTTGNIIEEAGLALKFIKKWAVERRHFPRVGAVSLMNTVIHEGDRLTINGRQTSPIDVAWMTERVDPASGIKHHMSTGRRLPSGEWDMKYIRTVAHF